MNLRNLLNQRNLILIIIILFSFGYPQIKLDIIEYRPFPDEVAILNLEPTKVCWSIANTFLLLDQNKGELFEIDQFGNFTLSGSVSKDKSSYAELIWIGFSPLGIQVADRLENELIYLDFRLNPIQRIRFNHAIFPELVSIDPWGRLFIYSKTYNSIYLFENSRVDKIPFINLSNELRSDRCIIDLENNEDGSMGVLDCNGFFHLFSQNGQLQESISIDIREPEFLISLRNDWMVFNRYGDCQSIKYSQIMVLPGSSRPILDIVSSNRSLAVLSNDHILIIDVRNN